MICLCSSYNYIIIEYLHLVGFRLCFCNFLVLANYLIGPNLLSMHVGFVNPKVAWPYETFTTLFASEGILPSMVTFVHRAEIFPYKSILAILAFIQLFAMIYRCVSV